MKIYNKPLFCNKYLTPVASMVYAVGFPMRMIDNSSDTATDYEPRSVSSRHKSPHRKAHKRKNRRPRQLHLFRCQFQHRCINYYYVSITLKSIDQNFLLVDEGMWVMTEVQILRTIRQSEVMIAVVPALVPLTKAMSHGINLVYLIQTTHSRWTVIAQGVTVMPSCIYLLY